VTDLSRPPYEFYPSPNFGPRKKPISALVLHYTGSMYFETALRWMLQPASHYSVHYLVGRDGRVAQIVHDDNVAWHAGRSAMKPKARDGDPTKEPHVDEFSLGVELVATHDSGYTDRQLASLYALVESLVWTYRIDGDRVVGHEHVAPGRKIDPSGYDRQFPWQKCREVAETAARLVQATRVRLVNP